MKRLKRRDFLKRVATASLGGILYTICSSGVAQAKDALTSPSADPLPDDVVVGAIREKWLALGGPYGFLGRPLTPELPTPDGVGRFNHFTGGSIYWAPNTGAYEVHGLIRDKWAEIGWERSWLGYPITDELPTPDGIGRFNHFTGGSIYWTPNTGAHEVHGQIRDKWAEIGWERSWLGYPITDELDFPEGGRVSAFERGAVYWWPDTGPIELNDVAVYYTGLVCFDETSWDQGSNSDEPYAVIGVVSPTGTWATRSQVYGDVDRGESRPDLLELYRGKPGGLSLGVLLMEHDKSDPDIYKEEIQKAVAAAFEGVTKLIVLIPAVGPVIAAVAGPILAAVAPKVGELFNRLLNLGDDKIGQTTIAITAKEMVVLAARTANAWERGVEFKTATPVLQGGGASYKVYFGIEPA
jgi:LGFP repeat